MQYKHARLFSTPCNFIEEVRLANPWFACHECNVEVTGSGFLKLAP